MESLVTRKPLPLEGSAGANRKAPTAAHKALITRNLRLAFGEVASEPVPKHLTDLLNQLDERDTGDEK
jgi:hypothetical protein